MQKVVCINPNCRTQLKRPPVPYIKCPSCKIEFFVFCHEFPNKTFAYNECRKCDRQLFYFFCFKCSSVLCYTKYRMGSITSCKCGFSGCYVVCNNCYKPQCYPPEKRYEGVTWKCAHCKKPFNFMTCDLCFHPVFSKKFETGNSFTCNNKKCKALLNVRKCQICNFIFMTNSNGNTCQPCYKFLGIKFPQQPQQINYTKIEPQFNPSFSTKSSTKSKDSGMDAGMLCKICLDKQAQYLNVKCFHLSCCGTCVSSMNNACPICRAQGEFRKVFT